MAGANPDPFSGLVIGSGPISIPHITTNTSTRGPSTVIQTVISQLPPPTLTNQTMPPVIPGGSVLSTHTVPLGMPGGSGPSTYVSPPVIHGGSGTSAHTVPLSIPGGSGPSTTMPQVPLVMQVHHVPTNPTAISPPSHITPSHIDLGPNMPSMAHHNLPNLA